MSGEQTTPAAATDEVAAAGETRRKPSAEVLKEARKLGKVIVHPSPEDVAANPYARGYDELGRLRPADARATYLLIPKPVEDQPDPSPEDRGRQLRKARKAAAAARKAAEKSGA